MSIRFGTSGWRSVIAEDFTFENVGRVTRAICRYLKKAEPGKAVIIGHDSRFMGEKFSAFAAKIAVEAGIDVLLCQGPTPTPTISHAIRSKGAGGGINFTASHNPPEYQGIKFSTSDGAPALPEVTSEIEAAIADIKDDTSAKGRTEEYDPKPAYLADLRTKIRFDVIAEAHGRFVFDPLWGTGRGYLDTALRDSGLEVVTLHDWRDVTFGGQAPEPGEKHLTELRDYLLENQMTMGLATDGDADRFGIIDSDGTFITPNQLVALLTDYLAESRGWRSGVARSVATSHLVDRVAEKWGLRLYETPVGFKYIGELINKGEIILGGEESAGLSIFGHYPEKDGILACLLAAESVAARGARLSDQLEKLTAELGKLESGRIGVSLTPEISDKLKDKLGQTPSEIEGRKIEKIDRLDGVKFSFSDGSWMLMRSSGTEPLVRIYAESDDKKDLEVLLEQGRKYLLG